MLMESVTHVGEIISFLFCLFSIKQSLCHLAFIKIHWQMIYNVIKGNMPHLQYDLSSNVGPIFKWLGNPDH